MTVYSKCLHPYIDKQGFAYGCGHCSGCRKSKSIEWNMRATHELITNNKAVYITLTYRQDTLPRGAKYKMCDKDELGIIKREDFTNFIKKLRKYVNKKHGERKLRYIYCTEYGPLTWRPHGHMIIYGLDYTEIKKSEIKKIWNKGIVDKSNEYVTEYCIAYISGYIRKKEKFRQAEIKYKNNNRPAPYLQASKGLGKEWAIKNVDSWSKTLKIGYRGYNLPTPRYYIKLIKKLEGRTIKYNKYEYTDGLIKKYIKYIRAVDGKIIERPKGNFNAEIIKTTVCYKIIENPYGKYTSIINKNMIENMIKESKNWKDKYKLSPEQTKYIRKLYIKKINKLQTNKYITWHEIENISDENLSKCYSSLVSYEMIRPNRKHNKNDSNIEKTILKRLNSIAKHKDIKQKHAAFGKRDLLDSMEINNIILDK